MSKNGEIVSRISSLRLAVSLCVIFAAVLFVAPRPAAADSTTVNVSATTTNGQTITGSYAFTNSGTNDSIGTWSFDLSSLGLSNISGTSGNAVDVFSVDALTFVDFTVNSGTSLTLAVLDPSDLTPFSYDGYSGVLTWGGWNVDLLNSVTLTATTAPVAATPEPSSFVLFGLGILLLLALVRFSRYPGLNPARVAS